MSYKINKNIIMIIIIIPISFLALFLNFILHESSKAEQNRTKA